MFTQESINSVRSADIVSVISKYIKLSPHNKSCCPFHNEKSPSFSVSPSKQIFKCYGCGVGGDVIEFVKQHLKCGFFEAIEEIANAENIDLEKERNFDINAHIKSKQEKKSLRQILNQAFNLYKKELWSDTHTESMDYWISRGYSKDVIAFWGLGFAPLNMHFLTRTLTLEGSLPDAVKLGLCKEKDDKLHRDVFINRVMIPIVDEQGEIVTFAGRVIEKESKYPKYMNGSSSPLYDKSKTLFGLYQAIPTIKEQGYAILVEGYTDVISMHTAGARNTIATCGTALTHEMALLLKKYTNTVVIMRDADNAGEKAGEKDIGILLKLGFRVEILPIEEGQDPDTVAKKYIIEYDEEVLII